MTNLKKVLGKVWQLRWFVLDSKRRTLVYGAVNRVRSIYLSIFLFLSLSFFFPKLKIKCLVSTSTSGALADSRGRRGCSRRRARST
jgi:hypothetical protein